MSTHEERWSEDRAVQSLRETGALVEGYRAWGVTIPNAAAYHRSIRKAHDARDWDTYLAALAWYVDAYRAAYRKGEEEEGC